VPRSWAPALLTVLVAAEAGSQPRAPEPAYAIVGADILTMREPALLRNHTVLIRAGRIAVLGPADSIRYDTAEVTEIDGRGRFVMPGLIDAHVHLRESAEEALIRYLRAGITTVRDMNGRPFLLQWRDQIARGERAGPTLVVASPTLGNFTSPREGYATPRTTDEGRAAVRRFHAEGYDWIKIYSFLPADAFTGIIDEARRLGIPVGGHVPVELGPEAIASGLRSIEHLTEYPDAALDEADRERADADLRTVFHAGRLDPGRLDDVVKRTASAGVWNVATIVWFDRNLPTPRARDAWRHDSLRAQGAANRRLIVRRLHEAGARLAIGTDSDGLGEHLSPSAILDELHAMAESGLDRRDVLRAATVGGAELLGLIEEIGTVEVGKRADLLVLYCDPRANLDCLADIEWVVAHGRLPVYEEDRRRARRLLNPPR
jgi:imidazolonepropionase-like amidohydrolase